MYIVSGQTHHHQHRSSCQQHIRHKYCSRHVRSKHSTWHHPCIRSRDIISSIVRRTDITRLTGITQHVFVHIACTINDAHVEYAESLNHSRWNPTVMGESLLIGGEVVPVKVLEKVNRVQYVPIRDITVERGRFSKGMTQTCHRDVSQFDKPSRDEDAFWTLMPCVNSTYPLWSALNAGAQRMLRRVRHHRCPNSTDPLPWRRVQPEAFGTNPSHSAYSIWHSISREQLVLWNVRVKIVTLDVSQFEMSALKVSSLNSSVKSVTFDHPVLMSPNMCSTGIRKIIAEMCIQVILSCCNCSWIRHQKQHTNHHNFSRWSDFDPLKWLKKTFVEFLLLSVFFLNQYLQIKLNLTHTHPLSLSLSHSLSLSLNTQKKIFVN